MVEYQERNLNERLRIVETKVDMILHILKKMNIETDDIPEVLTAKPKGYKIGKYKVGKNEIKNPKP